MPDADSEKLWLSDKQAWAVGFSPTSASLARLPMNSGWGYGLSLNEDEYLGAHTSGAFGTDLRSGMVWASRTFEHGLGDGWTLDATGTLATSRPHYEKGAIFQASPSVFSALAMRIGNRKYGTHCRAAVTCRVGCGHISC